VISNKLRGQNVKWVVVGSASLALQGLKVTPNDLDILTNKKGAHAMNKLLKEYEVKPVSFGRSTLFESHFGKFKVGEMRVEVMGNLKLKLGGTWRSYTHRLRSPAIIAVDGMKIPVSSLRSQFRSTKLLHRRGASLRALRIEKRLREVARG